MSPLPEMGGTQFIASAFFGRDAPVASALFSRLLEILGCLELLAAIPVSYLNSLNTLIKLNSLAVSAAREGQRPRCLFQSFSASPLLSWRRQPPRIPETEGGSPQQGGVVPQPRGLDCHLCALRQHST